jgi:GT2 family glycosyltransferase
MADVKEVIGCIPCFNARDTLANAIDSLRRQSDDLEVVVVDDGSADDSALIGEKNGAKVLKNARNLGRGGTRARSVAELGCAYILFCDAGLALAPDFLARALSHVERPGVAAVFGQVIRGSNASAVERWEGRHLFRNGRTQSVEEAPILITGACLIRRAAVLEVGNFSSELRESEDAELGVRLRAKGFRVLFDPALCARPIQSDSLGRALERYSRWNTAPGDVPRWAEYPKLAAYGVKTMAAEDLRQGDPASALISAIAPHYQFWRARLRRFDDK